MCFISLHFPVRISFRFVLLFVCGLIRLGRKSGNDLTLACSRCTMCFSHDVYLTVFFIISLARYFQVSADR